MSRCILHIGMHKTGTSSIQQSLNGFANDAFVYADINGHPNHSSAIFNLLGYFPDPKLRNQKNTTEAEALSILERSIKKVRGRTYILSGEGIGLLPQKKLESLQKHLRNWFDEIIIVAAVRSPAAYMASAFQEPVKRGAERDWRELAKQYRSYEKSFGKFEQVFGRANVHLWKFDPKVFPNGCAVCDFCNRLGINLPVERIVRVNESLSREATGLLYTYRKLGREVGSVAMEGVGNRKLVSQLMGIGDGKFRFSPDVVRPVLEQNRADIQWMEERLGQSLDEDLGEDRPGDVRDESDLLRPDPVAIGKLLALLGDRAPKGIKGETPEEVALLVHALRANAGSSNETAKRKTRMTEKDSKPPVKQESGQINVAALIAQMQQSNPDLLQGIPKAKAAELLRSAFKQVQEVLAQTQEGTVAFGGLGQFRIRQVQKEVEGKQIARTQIVFKGAEAGKSKKMKREDAQK